MLTEKLNIKCDKCANKTLPMLQDHSIFLPHPQLPAAQPYLITHDKTIIQDLANALHHAAVTLDYKEYLQKKFEWMNDDSHEVNWNASQLATKHIKPQNQHTLHKYLHNWLP